MTLGLGGVRNLISFYASHRGTVASLCVLTSILFLCLPLVLTLSLFFLFYIGLQLMLQIVQARKVGLGTVHTFESSEFIFKHSFSDLAMEINVTNHIALLFAGIVTPQDMIFFLRILFWIGQSLWGRTLYGFVLQND